MGLSYEKNAEIAVGMSRVGELEIQKQQSNLSIHFAKNLLTDSYLTLEAILDNVGCGICVTDLEHEQILFSNVKFRFFFSGNMMDGAISRLFILLGNGIGEECSMEFYQEENDAWLDVHRTEILWIDGKRVALYTIHDITIIKRYQQVIERQVSSDFLTGLYSRIELEKKLREAILESCDEFEVYYQPIIDISKSGNPCTGAEALIRWNSKSLGFISPADFIPIAEYLGLIIPIGNHVLEKACRRCKYWNDAGHSDFKVNVNLSVVQLLQNDMADKVRSVIEDTKIRPGNLTLEVTESLAINDMARMKEILGEIKKLGVRVALDDFGTGYSSLNHIREMPIDVIKIDRCFIKDLGTDEFAAIFLQTIGGLAETIGMNLCVEGVETQKQYKSLKEMNITMMQGFYFDRALHHQAFEKKYLV